MEHTSTKKWFVVYLKFKLTRNPAFLFTNSGSVTDFPSLTLAPHFRWFSLSWSEIPGGDICGDGKGWNGMVSLPGTTGKASQKAPELGAGNSCL